ncbi:MAG: Sir2 family NAD-dependent protein deacetylase [Fuerstiella sp.]
MSHDQKLEDAITQIVAWLRSSSATYAFTGAGISTESGIPDFRSPGGVWSKNRTVYFDDFCANASDRYEYWRQKAIAHQDFIIATPNVTHTTLAYLENAGLLNGVITQNIDGLHQDAGSHNVLELHGTARRIACLSCDWNDVADMWVDKFCNEDAVPDCPACGGLLKHATISFGQSLSQTVLSQAFEWSASSSLFLAMGSSLVVNPAASLPQLAAERGAKLVIINRGETPLDHVADLVVNAPLGTVMSAIGNQVLADK